MVCLGADSDGGAELSAPSFSPRWKEIGRIVLSFRRVFVLLQKINQQPIIMKQRLLLTAFMLLAAVAGRGEAWEGNLYQERKENCD